MARFTPGKFIKRVLSGYTFNRYREVFDLAEYAIMIGDCRTHKFIRVNSAAEKLFGYSEAELRNMTPFDLSSQPDSIRENLEIPPAPQAVIAVARRKDGELITVKIVASFTEKFNVSIISDVTEEYRLRRALETSEERLKEAQRVGRFGWWEFKPESGKYIISEEFYKLHEEEIASSTFTYNDHLAHTHPEDRSYLRTIIEDALEQKKETYSLTYRIITTTGKVKTITVNAFVKYDENGKMISRFGTFQDVSENQRIMDELVAARSAAEESDKLKTTFLANFSHEIRTPLNAMMGFVHILTSMKTTNKEREEMVGLIETNSQRLLRLINDMIDLSRVETNNLEIKYTNVDISKFLDSLAPTIAFEKESSGKTDITLHLDKDRHYTHIYQYIDELRLSQIFSNLINNALKFTEKGEVHFGYMVNQNANRFNITYFVSDTGPGINPDKQAEIFKPFVQFWGDDTPKVQGAGLGLAICRRMTELMKGHIWVESEPGKGSTFFFSFNTPVIAE